MILRGKRNPLLKNMILALFATPKKVTRMKRILRFTGMKNIIRFTRMKNIILVDLN